MSVSLSTVTMKKNPAIKAAGSEFISKYLRRQAPVESVLLSNKLKIATQESNTGLATIGLHQKTGSRFDSPATSGLSSAYHQALVAHVKQQAKAFGGQVVSSHGREVQSIQVSVHKNDANKAIELLASTTSPAFTDKLVSSARNEAIDQLKESENLLPYQVFQNLLNQAYETTAGQHGGGLGLNQYGTGEYLKGANLKDDLQAFHDSLGANPATSTLVATGDVNIDAVAEEAEKHFGSLAEKRERPLVKRYTGGASRHDASTPAAPYTNHIALGWEICPSSGADILPLQVLLEHFGNYDRFRQDLTSNWYIRLNYERQSTQMGFQPLEEVRPFMETFSDTGLMGFYFTHNHGANTGEEGTHFLQALQAQWIRYCMRLPEYEVEVGKNLLKSKLLFQNDGAEKSNANIGKQIVQNGAFTPIEQSYSRIDDLTTQQVSDVINHYYYDREPTLSAWGIYYLQPVWNSARRHMYKYRY